MNEEIKILWKIIDQMQTAALEIKDAELLRSYVLRKTTEAERRVPYPGEPEEAADDEDDDSIGRL